MIHKLKLTPGIYLVGFMASGKTTIGRQLAYELGWSFADNDEDIEAEQKETIAHIFETRGEEEFRKIETRAIQKRVKSVRTGRPMVVSLGGGAFSQQENFELLESNGITIWLDCPLVLVRARLVIVRRCGSTAGARCRTTRAPFLRPPGGLSARRLSH
jgi:shikimate kinase